jgi:hypothetical protein
MKKLIALICAAMLCACSSGDGSSGGGVGGGGGGSAPQVVTIDQGARLQVISGWEATAEIDERAGDVSLTDARTMATTAVNQAGINRLRV